MCGRYTLATPADGLVEAFDVPSLTFEWAPRFNIAPGQLAPIVAEDRRGRRMGLLTWGFVPAGRGRPGRPLINARAESVASRPSFRAAFRRRRCLVPADGFYEWKRVDVGRKGGGVGRDAGKSTPWWIHPVAGEPISLGGIWERWRGLDGEQHHGFAILTTAASPDVSAVHDRMPLMVRAGDRADWLDRETPEDRLASLLVPAPRGTFGLHRVSSRVNRASEDDPRLIEPDEPGG